MPVALPRMPGGAIKFPSTCCFTRTMTKNSSACTGWPLNNSNAAPAPPQIRSKHGCTMLAAATTTLISGACGMPNKSISTNVSPPTSWQHPPAVRQCQPLNVLLAMANTPNTLPAVRAAAAQCRARRAVCSGFTPTPHSRYTRPPTPENHSPPAPPPPWPPGPTAGTRPEGNFPRCCRNSAAVHSGWWYHPIWLPAPAPATPAFFPGSRAEPRQSCHTLCTSCWYNQPPTSAATVPKSARYASRIPGPRRPRTGGWQTSGRGYQHIGQRQTARKRALPA